MTNASHHLRPSSALPRSEIGRPSPFHVVIAIFLSIVLAAVSGPPPALATDGDAARAPFCLLLDDPDPSLVWDVMDRLSELGCDELAAHGAGVLEGRAPAAAVAALDAIPRVERVFLRQGGPLALKHESPEVEFRLRRWQFSQELSQAADERPSAKSFGGGACIANPVLQFAEPPAPAKQQGARHRPELERIPRYNNVWGAADFQTSEFLLGRTVVGIITPDVYGTGQWTNDELLAVHQAVRDAMFFWKSRASKWSDAPVYLAFEYFDRLPSEREVLTSNTDIRFVRPLMTEANAFLDRKYGDAAGKIPDTPLSTFPECYRALNRMRRVWTADWAFFTIVGWGSVFTGAPGLGAYAYLGGPFLVAPSGSSYGLMNVLTHEMGHIWFALDEYASGGTSSPCSAASGYLRVPNRNSANENSSGCIQNRVPCAMNVPARRACTFTEGMMGIKDSDSDGIRDILDTQPIVELFTREGEALFDSLGRYAIGDTIQTLNPVFEGLVRDSPIPNLVRQSGTGAVGKADYRPSITMNWVESAEYRVDDGDWQWIRPDSSGYDVAVEDFRLELKGLAGGEHTIYFRGTNSAGNSTEPRAQTKHTVVVQAVALEDLQVATEREGGLTVTWKVRGEAWGTTGRLYRREDSGNEELLLTVPLQSDKDDYRHFDRDVRPGHRYTYRIETTAFGKRYAVDAEAVASVPIRGGESSRLSTANPNPFRDLTYLSFSVPQGALSPIQIGNGGNKPGPPPTLPTYSPGATMEGAEAQIDFEILPVFVKITIYDVTGRAVRNLFEGHLGGSSIYTASWDGRDDDGNELAGGVYFTRLKTGTFEDTNKVVLVR